MSRVRIPFGRLETIFLDAGNTLISWDFDWVAGQLAAAGLACTSAELMRAEAAARPAVSAAVERGVSTEGMDVFELYLRSTLAGLAPARALAPGRREDLIARIAPILRGPSRQRLWSRVIPGVPQALRDMRAMGLGLFVVSNSDGNVSAILEQGGLAPLLDGVVDSSLVGTEKPDRRIFDHALLLAGASRETTLHVGDILAVDVVGARRAGLHALLLDPHGDWTDADCERLPDLQALSGALRHARS